MDSFERREEGFERAFSRDEELRFKARARRNRRLGAWAGEKFGLSGQALADYATALVDRELASADDEALVAELARALDGVEPKVSEHRIRRRLDELGQEALRDLHSGR